MSDEIKTTTEASTPKVEFKKLSNFNRRRNVGRKIGVRSSSDSSSSSSEDTAKDSVVVKAKKGERRKNVLFQATGGYQKKMRLNGGDNDEDNSGDQAANLVSVSYKASRTAERVGPGDLGATSSIQIDTEYDHDETALRKKAIELNKQLKDKTDDKTYRGLKNYQQFYEKKDSILGNAGSGLNTKGPVRASGNIRATTRWDYEPCICKDYKETGYCGFGDSCKFLHDRSDYKMGWQIERQMEEGTYHPEDMSRYVIESSGSESEDEDLPFRCYICRESFVDPIVTKCKHYFCEKCALDFYQKKSTRCYVCGEPTTGVFNPAKDIVAKIKRLQEKRQQKKESDESDEGEPISTFTSEEKKNDIPANEEDDDDNDDDNE